MSKSQKSLKVNFIMNAILTMSSFIFPLITFPYISRILLPVGTGKVAFATSLISNFNMIAQLGIPTYGIRACAKVRDNKEELSRTAHELLFINIIMSIFSYIVLFLAIILVPKLQDEKTLYAIVSITIILNAIGMEWLYKALEQYAYITIRSIIFKFIALIAMFLLIHQEKDYVLYGAISIFAASASCVFNFVNVHKYISLKPVGNYNISRHFKVVGVFFAMSCATTIYTHLDTLMLGFMTNDTEVGYYNASVKIKQILVSIVTSLGTVLLPRASYYIQHNKYNEFKTICKKAINFVCLLSIPMCIYFILFAEQSISFLSGSQFEGAILPMQVIMPTLIFIGLTNILGIQMLVPLGRENIVLYSEIAGAIINLIINAMLIPNLGSVGAAIGTVAAEAVVLFVQYRALKDEVSIIFRKLPIQKVVISLIVAVCITIWIPNFIKGSFLTLLTTSILFFSTYGIILILLKEEFVTDIFFQVLNSLKRKLHINFRR